MHTPSPDLTDTGQKTKKEKYPEVEKEDVYCAESLQVKFDGSPSWLEHFSRIH